MTLTRGAEFVDVTTKRVFVFDETELRGDGVMMARGFWVYYDRTRDRQVRNRGGVLLDLLLSGDRFSPSS